MTKISEKGENYNKKLNPEPTNSNSIHHSHSTMNLLNQARSKFFIQYLELNVTIHMFNL
jgi:hypothetical protein